MPAVVPQCDFNLKQAVHVVLYTSDAPREEQGQQKQGQQQQRAGEQQPSSVYTEDYANKPPCLPHTVADLRKFSLKQKVPSSIHAQSTSDYVRVATTAGTIRQCEQW